MLLFRQSLLQPSVTWVLFSIFQHTHKWVTHPIGNLLVSPLTLLFSLFFLFGLLLYIDFVLSNFGSLALSCSLFLSCLLLSSLQNLGICENKVPHQGIILTHETHQKMMTQSCTDQKRFEVVWPLCVQGCQLRFWCIPSTPIRQK